MIPTPSPITASRSPSATSPARPATWCRATLRPTAMRPTVPPTPARNGERTCRRTRRAGGATASRSSGGNMRPSIRRCPEKRCPLTTATPARSRSPPAIRPAVISAAKAGWSTSASTICVLPPAAATSSKPARTRRKRCWPTPISTARTPARRASRAPARQPRPRTCIATNRTCATGAPAIRLGRAARAKASSARWTTWPPRAATPSPSCPTTPAATATMCGPSRRGRTSCITTARSSTSGRSSSITRSDSDCTCISNCRRPKSTTTAAGTARTRASGASPPRWTAAIWASNGSCIAAS